MVETIEKEFVPVVRPTSWLDEDFEGSWDTNYNRKICWFLSYFYDLDDRGMSYGEFVMKYNILHPDGVGFKLNLLPIRFSDRASVEWSHAVKSATGFDSFAEYRAWCVTHRGQFFRDQMQLHRPRLLVCTGIGEQANFFNAFTNGAEPQLVQLKDFSISVARLGDTLVCVTPFFGGPSGINSYAKMEQLVAKLQELLKQGVTV